MRLLLILLCPTLAFAHITDEERPWIIGIQDAAKKIEDENKLLSGLLQTAGDKRASAEQSVGRYEVLYGQLQTEHITAQKEVEKVADERDAANARAHDAEIAVAKKSTRILQLWIATGVLGAGCVLLGWFLIKP